MDSSRDDGRSWEGRMKRYVVATRKPWNHRVFHERLSHLEGEWHLLTSLEDFEQADLTSIGPDMIFFPHWSWMVEENIVSRYECVAFHMSDLPYGRGGSPLQNLILRGRERTKLTAFRMTDELDAGPVYNQRDLSLSGTAESIFIRAAELIGEMIEEIVRETPEPSPQEGQVTTFSRRTPEESEISEIVTLHDLHDFIRMLDAEGYPRAFLEHEGFKMEFTRSAEYDEEIRADVRITAKEEHEDE